MAPRPHAAPRRSREPAGSHASAAGKHVRTWRTEASCMLAVSTAQPGPLLSVALKQKKVGSACCAWQPAVETGLWPGARGRGGSHAPCGRPARVVQPAARVRGRRMIRRDLRDLNCAALLESYDHRCAWASARPRPRRRLWTARGYAARQCTRLQDLELSTATGCTRSACRCLCHPRGLQFYDAKLALMAAPRRARAR